MKYFVALLAFVLFACHSAPAAKTAAQARADARAAVVTVESAWMLVAQTCVDVAATEQNGALLTQCAAVLDPVRQDLEAADEVVNAWTDATSNQPLACAVLRSLADVEEAAAILGVRGPALVDAETVVTALVQANGGCVDGGK